VIPGRGSGYAAEELSDAGFSKEGRVLEQASDALANQAQKLEREFLPGITKNEWELLLRNDPVIQKAMKGLTSFHRQYLK
jgi:hypothetical protein